MAGRLATVKRATTSGVSATSVPFLQTFSRFARSRIASTASRLQQHKARVATRLQPVAPQLHHLRRIASDRIEAVADTFLARHLRHMQAHVRHLQHVAAAHAVPGVHDAVVAKGDVDACGQQLGNAGHAPALGVAVVPALQGDVDQRIGDHADAALGNQGQQLAHVVVVHRRLLLCVQTRYERGISALQAQPSASLPG